MSGTCRRSSKLLLAALVVVCLPSALTLPQPAATAGSLHDSIRDAQRKVVKIYGADRGREELGLSVLLAARRVLCRAGAAATGQYGYAGEAAGLGVRGD